MRTVLLQEKGLSIDYIEIVDPETLAPFTVISGEIVILVAVRLGRTRLIDNIVLLP
jgi:pantoate--beta-alanine ligase